MSGAKLLTRALAGQARPEGKREVVGYMMVRGGNRKSFGDVWEKRNCKENTFFFQ